MGPEEARTHEHKIESKGLNKPFFEYKGLEVF